jgi:AraC-like DNA-binding protein
MLISPYIKDISDSEFIFSHNISTTWSMKDYHFHDSFEILFTLSNTTKFFVEDAMYDVEKNDLFIMNDMELHKTIAPKDVVYDRYIIMFHPKYVDGFSTASTNPLKCFLDRDKNFINRRSLSEDQSHALISLLKKVEFYHKNITYASDLYKKIAFIELLLFVNSLYENHNAQKSSSTTADFKKVELILEYINQHLHEDLSLDNLSKIFFLSKYYIGHIFKANTGFSVTEYIINRRILKSRELLQQDLSISEIALRVGFRNECHFIRTFKSYVGISPKKYSKGIKLSKN